MFVSLLSGYQKQLKRYTAETWTCTKSKKSNLQAVEMEFLRGILGKTRRDRIRNTLSRGELKKERIWNQTEESRAR
jgi:hypothetical protein